MYLKWVEVLKRYVHKDSLKLNKIYGILSSEREEIMGTCISLKLHKNETFSPYKVTIKDISGYLKKLLKIMK